MIGKVGIGNSSSGVLRYVWQRPEASILYAEGVRETSIQSAADDFNMQRKMNPELGKPVGHIVLSWSANDKAKLSPEKMVACAKEYLQKMKIGDTQYLIAEHKDKKHPHLHIIYSRVNNQGKTISDRFQKQRNHKARKEITLKYGYHLGRGKQLVNRQQLKGEDKIRYELYDTIKVTSATAASWDELTTKLGKQGIETIFKYNSGTSEIQDISFSKGGLQFKGSKIDRSRWDVTSWTITSASVPMRRLKDLKMIIYLGKDRMHFIYRRSGIGEQIKRTFCGAMGAREEPAKAIGNAGLPWTVSELILKKI